MDTFLEKNTTAFTIALLDLYLSSRCSFCNNLCSTRFELKTRKKKRRRKKKKKGKKGKRQIE